MTIHAEFMSDRPQASHDALTSILESVHLGGSLYFRSELRAPWGLEVPASDAAQFHVIRAGSCWLRPSVAGGFDAMALSAGDIVVLPHGDAHVVADGPATPAVPLQELLAHVPEGERDPVHAPLRIGGDGAQADLICGFFSFDHGSAHPLLSVLPPVLSIRGEGGRARSWLESSLDLIAQETIAGRPGRGALFDRLTEALFIQVLQTTIEELAYTGPSWLAGLRDPLIGEALGLMHAHADDAWTVQSLAARVGMSRSAFASRFRGLVGESPLQYLTRWRMQVAANHLREGHLTLAQVADRVGYRAEASFSKVFKRYLGVAPGTYRRRGATGAPRREGHRAFSGLPTSSRTSHPEDPHPGRSMGRREPGAVR